MKKLIKIAAIGALMFGGIAVAEEEEVQALVVDNGSVLGNMAGCTVYNGYGEMEYSADAHVITTNWDKDHNAIVKCIATDIVPADNKPIKLDATTSSNNPCTQHGQTLDWNNIVTIDWNSIVTAGGVSILTCVIHALPVLEVPEAPIQPE